MAMNAINMGIAVANAVKAIWDNAPRTHEIDDDYSIEQFWITVCTQIVNHITSNAKCNGTDSNGDSHGNVGII